MKSRFPICYFSAILSTIIYIASVLLAYFQYPEPFSIGHNWLSDLGNQIVNPRGAPFYNVGVVLTSLLLAVWFIGLSQWRLKQNTANQRLLTISQITGIVASFALIMSALNPINKSAVHALWSQIHFILSGIGFAFSVTALRYHRGFTNKILVLGFCSSILPFLMYTLGKGQTYWMEWVAVGFFILYILTVGISTRLFVRSV
jgi:hypothetical protein